MTLNEFIAESLKDLDKSNQVLKEEGLEPYTAESYEGFKVYWTTHHLLKPNLYPMTDEGLGDLFWMDEFAEWEETGEVNEEDLKDMLED